MFCGLLNIFLGAIQNKKDRNKKDIKGVNHIKGCLYIRRRLQTFYALGTKEHTNVITECQAYSRTKSLIST